MTQAVKSKQLKYLILAAGLLGFLLRTVLYRSGVDAKGLLIPDHWANISVWLLTATVAPVLAVFCRQLRGSTKYEDCLPPSVPGAVGCILAAAGFFLTESPAFGNVRMDLILMVLRFGSAAALLVLGFFRFTGRKPSFLLHCVVCAYLALYMVCQYRIWSADPQLQNYAFYLGACVALVLTAYQMAAMDAGFGSHAALWACGLSTLYLAITALAASPRKMFLLCAVIWVLTNLSQIQQPRRNRTNPATSIYNKEDSQ